MSIFDKLFRTEKLPIAKIKEVYTICFQTFSEDIIDAMQKQNLVISNQNNIHIDLNSTTRFTNVMTEYALFLKVCVIHYLKKRGITFSQNELDKAFPVVEQLTDALYSIPEYKKALKSRINDYFYSINNKITCGYCMQNYIAPHYYSFLDTLCKEDNTRLAFFFVDCFYYVSKTEKFITSEQILTLKELTFNIGQNESCFYENLASTVKSHATVIEKKLSEII